MGSAESHIAHTKPFWRPKFMVIAFSVLFWVNVLTHLNWVLVWYYSFQRSYFHQTACCWRANYRVSQRKANTWKVIQESCFRRERNIHVAIFFIQMAGSIIHSIQKSITQACVVDVIKSWWSASNMFQPVRNFGNFNFMGKCIKPKIDAFLSCIMLHDKIQGQISLLCGLEVHCSKNE